MNNQVAWTPPECARWSNRLLIASLTGISYLTLFPFQLNFSHCVTDPLRPYFYWGNL